MPCYEVRTVSVEFKAENRQLLDAAIKSLGLSVVQLYDGRLNIDYNRIVLDLTAGTARVEDGFQDKLNALKRAYSKECIKAAAKKSQWVVKFQGNSSATVSKLKW